MTRTGVRALLSTALLVGAFAASAADADFERMLRGEYASMLFNAKKAYEGKRYEEAFKTLQRTACAGDKESQSAIGRMYLLGQGVARNDLTGYAWLKVAAETKMRGYQSIVDTLRQAMTPAQRQVADEQAATLIDQYGLRTTNMSCSLGSSRGGLIKDTVTCVPRSEGAQVLLKRCVATAPAAAK